MPVTHARLLNKKLNSKEYAPFTKNDIHFEDGREVTVGDLLYASTEIFKPIEHLESEGIYINKFLHENYILERLQTAIMDVFTKNNLGEWKDKRPTFKEFLLRKTGTSPFRNLLQVQKAFSLKDDGICQRWELRLETKLSTEKWRRAFRNIHRGWCDPDFRFFHFKHLNLILGVGEKLQHTKERINPGCIFCSKTNRVPPIETSHHLFWHCESTSSILDQFFEWQPIKILHGDRNNIAEFMIHKQGFNRTHEMVINSIYTWAKYYLFSCRYNDSLPNFVALKQFIIKNGRDINNILVFKGKNSDFSVLWSPEEFMKRDKDYIMLTAAALSSLPVLADIPQFNRDFARTDEISVHDDEYYDL